MFKSMVNIGKLKRTKKRKKKNSPWKETTTVSGRESKATGTHNQRYPDL